MSPVKWRPSCHALNVLTSITNWMYGWAITSYMELLMQLLIHALIWVNPLLVKGVPDSRFYQNISIIGRWDYIRAWHYNDVIMSSMASQITRLTIVYSAVYSGADQRKHQSSASLAFVRGIHRGPVNSPHKGPVTRKMFPFDDVIIDVLMISRHRTHIEIKILPKWRHFSFSACILQPYMAMCMSGNMHGWFLMSRRIWMQLFTNKYIAPAQLQSYMILVFQNSMFSRKLTPQTWIIS